MTPEHDILDRDAFDAKPPLPSTKALIPLIIFSILVVVKLATSISLLIYRLTFSDFTLILTTLVTSIVWYMISQRNERWTGVFLALLIPCILGIFTYSNITFYFFWIDQISLAILFGHITINDMKWPWQHASNSKKVVAQKQTNYFEKKFAQIE